MSRRNRDQSGHPERRISTRSAWLPAHAPYHDGRRWPRGFTRCQRRWHGAHGVPDRRAGPRPRRRPAGAAPCGRRCAAGWGVTVRWTHVAELPDITHLLRGGELLLSTGVAFPDDPRDLADLRRRASPTRAPPGSSSSSAVATPSTCPPPSLEAAERLGLPVIELRRETPFVQVTEAVHALIVGRPARPSCARSDEVHRTFTELSIEGADPEAIVRQTARMAKAPGRPREPGPPGAGLRPGRRLGRPAARPLGVPVPVASRTTGRTTVDAEQGWVVATVGARGTDWGRLVIVLDGPGDQPRPRRSPSARPPLWPWAA